MPFIPTPNGVEVVMEYDNYGQIAQNVFHVKANDPIDSAYLTAIAASFKNWFVASLSNEITTGVKLNKVKVTDISVAGGAGVEYVTGLPASGDLGVIGMPQNVTAAVKLSTGLTGRSQRGRSYIVGLPNSAQDGQGHLNAIHIPLYQTIYQTLIDNMSANDWPLQVLSKFHLGAPRVTGQLTEILTASVNRALDSQRRRLPERGL